MDTPNRSQPVSENSTPELLALQKSNQILSETQQIISSLFDEAPHSKKALIDTLLQSIGHVMGVSRAYVFEAYTNQESTYRVNQTNEWVAEGIEPQIDNPITQHVNLNEIGFERWQTGLLSNQIVNDTVANLPKGLDKEVLESQNIKAIVLAPIFVKNQWRGFIGFDDCIDGSPWEEVEVNALKLCAQTIGAAFGFLDITQSKQLAEKQAENVKQKIHNALESAEHGVWDWDLRTDKVYYSEILEKQLGYNGHEFTDALTEWSGRVHPDDIEATYKKVQDHLEGKTSVYRAEFRMRRKDGSYAWMLAIAKAVRDKDGKPIRLPGTHTDLSFQKKLEAELHKQQELLQSLVRGFPDLVWLKDKQGIYLAANTRFEDFFGRPTEEIIGKTDYDFVDEAQANSFRHHDRAAMANGTPSINEETITFASDGHQETLETIKTPIHFKNGDLIGVLSVGRDITNRKKTEQQLALSASVFSNAHDGILICDANINIIDVNPMFEEISGYSKEEVIGKNPKILSSGIQGPGFYKSFWRNLQSEGFWKGELWNRKKNGEAYAILSNVSIIKDDAGEISHYVSIFSDISYLKQYQKQLETIAHYDQLTSLPNRALLADRLEEAILHANESEKLLAVCFIDLDNFKPINDRYGHEMGDRILQKISSQLTHYLKEEDTLARFGGDEFILLLSDQSNEASVANTIDGLLKQISQTIEFEDLSFNISASVGITVYPWDNTDADGLIRHADQAMYEAKLQGKKRFHFFDVKAAKEYRQLNKDLLQIQNGLATGEFVLYYQPKVNLKNTHIIGFEALIRWQHPTEGLRMPDSFLPAIENHALSYELDCWVLNQALQQLNKWRKHHIEYSLSINISPSSLLSSSFVDELTNQLEQYSRVNPAQLEIEVLETSNFREIKIAENNLSQIQQLGVKIALDDFGTGASSLSYLKALPANTIKIDQSFIFDILEDRSDLVIVEGIIQLARVFDLQVIAEGVETKEHAEILYALGCYLIQGYWIAKPIAPEDLDNFIANWHLPGDFKYQ